jgi:hypothetical protein
MLLWAMQSADNPDGRFARSIRAVARAVGKNEATVRGWKAAHEWEGRSVGGGGEAAAVRLYRAEYVADYGRVDLPQVADRVVIPLTGDATTQADEVIQRSRAHAQQPALIDRVVQNVVADRRTRDREQVDRQVTLVDAVLGTAAKQLREGKLKINARDIPAFIQTRQHLVDWLAHQDRLAGASRAPETVRVQYARMNGGDLLTAMFEDVEELRAIVDVLLTRRDAMPAIEQLNAAQDPEPQPELDAT